MVEIIAQPLPLNADAAKTRTATLRAAYYEGQINLKEFRARNSHYPVFSISPLSLEPERGAYTVITKFGAVIYWTCSEAAMQKMDEELRRLPGTQERNQAVEDTLVVRLGEAEDAVSFDEIRLTELTVEKLKLVSLVFGQSVALDRFELEVTEALKRFDPVVTELRESGRLALRQAEVMRAIGFGLSVRSAVLANLTLFDKPPEAWESETLSRLNSMLYAQFDLDERLAAINQKLEYFADVNSTIMDVLNNRKSQRLEWIIIILIFVEIVFFIWLELPGLL
jgi:uncharacterized Rmd1/YagE family protein